MHEDIHTPVCFLVAASQDRPGLGTPGNKPFGLLSEGEPPYSFFFPLSLLHLFKVGVPDSLKDPCWLLMPLHKHI